MTARIVTLADEIKNALDAAPAGTFGLAFNPKRSWLLPLALEDLATLNVVVTPTDKAKAIQTREHQRETHTVRVCVAQKVYNEDQLDALCELVQQIDDYLTALAFEANGLVFEPIDDSNSESAFDAGHLQNEKVFRAEIVLQYATIVAIN